MEVLEQVAFSMMLHVRMVVSAGEPCLGGGTKMLLGCWNVLNVHLDGGYPVDESMNPAGHTENQEATFAATKKLNPTGKWPVNT